MLENAGGKDVNIIPDHTNHIDFFNFTEPLMVCLVIFVLNNLVLPFFPDMSMKKRLGSGTFLVFLSVLSGAVIVASYDKLHHPFIWIFLPVAIISIGDTLVFVTGMCEFGTGSIFHC